MHLLPPLEHGERLVRLPLSDAAAMRLADLWLTDDEQQRREFYGLLLAEQPTLCIWVLARLEQRPASLADLVQWCEVHAIMAWRDASDSLRAPLEATDAQVQQWADWAAASVREPWQPAHIRQWLSAAPAVRSEAGQSANLSDDWIQSASVCSASAPRVGSGIEKRLRDEWLGSSKPFSNCLYRLADKLRQLRRLETRFSAALEEEKLAALKEFAYGASHEINNPLANISTRAQTLLREERDPERRRKLATINSQAFRAHEMISDLMLFARPPMIDPQPLNLPSLIDRVIEELQETATAQGTTLVHRSPDHDLTVMADETHLAVALKAICTNALEALAMGGRLTLWSKRSEQLTLGAEAEGPWIELGIHDSGPGIPPETRRHIFDPYFSGREAGRGLGLGLSKSWRIVNLHGGHIEVTSDESGTTFLIFLPLPRAARRPISGRISQATS